MLTFTRHTHAFLEISNLKEVRILFFAPTITVQDANTIVPK